MSGLELRSLSVAYGKTTVLSAVSLAVQPGETLVLFGPSGAGKTVLLRAVAGVEPSATGQVLIAGRDVTADGPERRDVGVAFQNFALYPHLSAEDNILSPLRARHVASPEASERVGKITTLLKIGHVLAQRPSQLSNGQKQRTALARALVGEPSVLLLDDPLRNVDAKLRYEMRQELPRLLRRAGAASVYVSQDYREAMALADRIAVLIGGHLVQVAGPEEVYDAPATVAVARLFGDPPVNLVPCRPEAVPGGVRVRALGFDMVLERDASAAGRDCLLGLRPDSLALLTAARPGAIPAELVTITPLHERQVGFLRTPDGHELLASVPGDLPPLGTPVWLLHDVKRALLYEAATGTSIARATHPAEAVA